MRLLPSLLGPIICWLPSNWLRIVVFESGAVHRDFGLCRGRSGLGPLGTHGQLRTNPQRIFFFLILCICGCFMFHCMHFHCCSSNRPCHTGIHIIIDVVSCFQLAVRFWENPSFGGLCFLSCKVFIQDDF